MTAAFILVVTTATAARAAAFAAMSGQVHDERLNLFAQPLEFFEPDMEKFQCLALAYEAIRRGGNAACVVNAANEVVNLAFRQGRCGFLDMGEIIAKTLDKATVIKTPTLEDYFASDKEARRIAEEMIKL